MAKCVYAPRRSVDEPRFDNLANACSLPTMYTWVEERWIRRQEHRHPKMQSIGSAFASH
jgi:hypothetical protein